MSKPGEVVPKRAVRLVDLAKVANADCMCRSSLHPAAAFAEMVQQERKRQDEKWGGDNYHGSLDIANTVLTEELGEFAKEVNDLRLGVATSDTPLVVELVQVAAVAQAIYEQVIHVRREKAKNGRRSSEDE